MTNAGGDAVQTNWTGDPRDIVALRDRDPAWKDEFLRERARPMSAQGQDVHRIDRLGSTAVPGLRARSVIDFLASVERLDPELFVGRLAVLGYVHVPIGEEGRRSSVKVCHAPTNCIWSWREGRSSGSTSCSGTG